MATEQYVQLPSANAPLGLKTATLEKTDSGSNVVEVQQMAIVDESVSVALGGAARVEFGSLKVDTESRKATYRTTSIALVTVTGATDIFTLIGSASKTVRVRRVKVSGSIQTAAQYVDINLVKRSAADTAGTSSAPALVPLDSTDSAATAVAAAYTANPTLGASVGPIDAQRVFCPLTGTPAQGVPIAVFEFGNRNGKGLVLRGVAQQLAVNLNAPGNAGTFDVSIEFTEEA